MTTETQQYALLADAVYDNLIPDPARNYGTNFKVVETYSDPSGFYGAIFRNTDTGELVVAFRGTDPHDLLRDLLTADGQMLVLGVNQQIDGARHLVERAIELSKADPETGGPVSVSVTGHSLGGTLAEVMSCEYNLYGETFNAYGAAGLVDVPENGVVASGHNVVVNHMRATDAVALANSHYGEVRKYATGDDVLFTLAAQDTDANQVLDSIFESAALNPTKTHGISYFIGDDSILAEENEQRYQAYHTELDLYQARLQLAAGAVGTGLALLFPELDAYLLSSYLGNKTIDFFVGTNAEDASAADGGMAYLRGTSNADTLNGSDNSDLLFGDDGSDVLYGGNGDDHMYGGDNDDYLDGEKGSDNLAGGIGHDRYNFSLSDLAANPGSSDVVSDSDGDGQIEIDNNVLAIGERLSEKTWETLDGKFELTANLSLASQTLVIRNKSSGSKVLVKDWSNGELGIQLGGDVPVVALAPITNDDDLFGSDVEANAGDDHVKALAGNDGLSAGRGDDYMDGDEGNDLIYGGSGGDHLVGGSGNDIITDDSEWVNFEDWSDVVGSDGTSPRTRAQQRIAELGDAVVAVGKGWYVYKTQDGNGWTYNTVLGGSSGMSDPNQLPGGDDLIDAGDGDDVVWSGEGNDIIAGGDGADYVDGGADDDVISAGAGDDQISGDTPQALIDAGAPSSIVSTTARNNGNDVLFGELGNDTISGDGGDDVIEGGDDDDSLHGNGSGKPADSADPDADYMLGGVGNDTLAGDDGNDTVDGGDGTDVLHGDNDDAGTRDGDDALYGYAGADTMFGGGGKDVLYAGTEDDLLLGDSPQIDGSRHGDDVLFGEVGNDSLAGGGGDDALLGGDGNDVINGDNDVSVLDASFHGNDYIDGGAGNDSLFGNSGDDNIFSGEGDDAARGGDGNDALYGSAGKDLMGGDAGSDLLDGGDDDDDLAGGAGDDRLSGGAGNDLLHGNDGIDVLDGGDGDDQLSGDAGNDILHGGAGNDLLHDGDGNDVLDGGDGQDSMAGEAGSDTLAAGAGDDLLNGGAGADDLNGGEGSDTLYGEEGDDALTGGAGNDVLIGGLGNDTYRFEKGFGQDLLAQLAGEDSGQDVIAFGAGIDAANLRYAVVGDSLIIRNATSDDVLSVRDYFSPTASIDIHFDDGSVITKDALATQLGLTGTVVVGSGDLIIGTDGNDRIYGDDGDNAINGLSGNDFISGGAGDDHIYGGGGQDVLEGGAGNDTYSAGLGYTEIMGLSDFDAGTDTINLPFTLNSVINYQISGDTLFVFSGPLTGGPKVVLDGFLAQGAPAHVLHFSDGTELTAAYFTAAGSRGVGTAGNDLLVGGGSNDRLYGKPGDDTLMGNGGDDYLQGDSGVDVLAGGDGKDTLVDADNTGEMRGGTGDDDYHVHYNEDRSAGQGLPDIVESAGEGADTVYTNAYSAPLPDNVEDVVIKPSSWIIRTVVRDTGSFVAVKPRTFTGNNLDNVMRVDTSGIDAGWSIPANIVYKLDGGLGKDTLVGNIYNDIYVVDRPEDVIVEPETSSSFDIVQAKYSYHLDAVPGIEEVQLLGTSDISAWGTNGIDVLDGSTSGGSNALSGGAGDDRYVVDNHDSILEDTDGGTDTVVFTASKNGSFNLGDYTNVENAEIGDTLFYSGLAGKTLYGNNKDNLLTGNYDDNIIRGGGGNDVIHGENRLHPRLSGSGRDSLFGDAGNDTLYAGSSGANLHGGAGDDHLVGGSGVNEFYYDVGDGADIIQSNFQGSPDKVRFGDGINPDDVVYSRDGSTLIVQVGSSPSDRLHVLGYWSSASEDAPLTGELGQLLFVFEDGSVHKGNLEQLPQVNNPPVVRLGSLAFDATEGREVSYQIPMDTFVDGVGDTLTLSLGNAPDWLTLDPATGVVTGTAPEGVGDVRFDVVATDSWGQTARSLVAVNVFHVVMGSDAGDSFVSEGPHDEIHGLAGNDVLDDGGHRDRLIGGTGDDTYEIRNSVTSVSENSGEGSDSVDAYSDYTLPENIEKLVLVEDSGANDGTGNAGDNSITGNSANNTLDGGAGADILIGGKGDDIYVIDNVNDSIVENDAEGVDKVLARVDSTLDTTLENLTLLGTTNLKGTGNDRDNVLIGNSGDNRLEGGQGADSLYGGRGNDYFIEESSGDWVYENVGEGLDTVERRYETNLVLKDNVEDLILAAGIQTGNGNGLDNTITGNAGVDTLGGWDGDDTLQGLDGDDALFGGAGNDDLLAGAGNDYLDGGTGPDRLEGGAGNDNYIVDDSGEAIVEAANDGMDQVQTTASYALAGNVENLFLTGDAAIDGTGNDLDNYIAGNAAANVVRGGGGVDTLVAGAGDDALVGGTGDDKYVFDVNSGSDVIDNADGGFDGVFFTGGITRDRLSFGRDGDDLLIFVDGATTASVRVTNHFLGGDAAVDYVQPDGGNYLTATEINQIVNGGGTGDYDQVVEGTAAGEQLVGSTGKDLVRGLAGDDQLFGMAGDDALQGDDGNDYLAGGNGSGTGSGADQLEGGAGNDTLAGEDAANALTGGAGDDKYIYGGGQDTIDNVDGGFDGVFFNDGITAEQLAFTRDGDDLVVTVSGDVSKTVRVKNHFLDGDAAIDYIQPASGNMLDTDAINALVGAGDDPGDGGGDPHPDTGNDGDYGNVVDGTNTGEQLLGSGGRDLIHGLGGNDTVFGFAGDDKFEGGDGDDYLSGGNGSFSGSGNDILIGDAGSDQLVGEDGNDTLMGGTGDDKYLWQAGSDADVIDNTGGGNDWLFFNGVDRSRLSFHQDGDDLIVMVDGDSAQQVRVLGHFDGGDQTISYVQPGSGYAISAAEIEGLLTPLPGGFAGTTAAASVHLNQNRPALGGSQFSWVPASDTGALTASPTFDAPHLPATSVFGGRRLPVLPVLGGCTSPVAPRTDGHHLSVASVHDGRKVPRVRTDRGVNMTDSVQTVIQREHQSPTNSLGHGYFSSVASVETGESLHVAPVFDGRHLSSSLFARDPIGWSMGGDQFGLQPWRDGGDDAIVPPAWGREVQRLIEAMSSFNPTGGENAPLSSDAPWHETALLANPVGLHRRYNPYGSMGGHGVRILPP